MQRPLALFDLDGTLVDRNAAFISAVTSVCQGFALGPEIENWILAELADRVSVADFVRMQEAFALTIPWERLWLSYVEGMVAATSCRPTVVEGLTQLRADNWTIGVVTNGASDIQRAKLTAAGLTGLVDGVAVSGDIDVRKPSPRLFELAARRCGSALHSRAWMVGDNPAGDIGGGHRAGLRTIWVRSRLWSSDVPSPDRTVNDVVDAIGILLNTKPE
ncbi:HAD family hydrolase [Streptomyces sp. NBC_00344]|uniref:HAD family hydrolase n=1 Tax=Streptomyces sp. NBC_00344 TaxID=2975720 RepID=UPI002E1DFA20